MPNLSALQSQAAGLAASIEAAAPSPERELARVQQQIARFDILKVRHAGGLELLNRIAEGSDAASQREVVASLCRSWWDAVLREMAAAVGQLPDAVAALSVVLPDDAPDATMREFVAKRLLELERVLVS